MADYTRSDLIAALRKADAAGDVEAARAIARRIRAQEARSQKGMGEQAWDAVKNVGAGFAEGFGALIDAPTEALAGTARIVARPAANLAEKGYRAVGLDNAADSVRRNARTFDRAMAEPMTVSRMADYAVPVPKDTPGKVARLGAGMLGAALTPLPSWAKPPAPRPTPPRQTPDKVPTVAQLKTKANELYDAAEARGITASKNQTNALKSRFGQIASSEGLISPTGRVSSAYPKAKEALDLVSDYAEGTMKPSQMKSVRKVLSDAAGSPDKSERRIASMMLREFDDWTVPLAPEFADARAVAHRYISAGKIDDAIEAAHARASQFSGSGLENALRTEFRGLDRAILRGKERGLIPEVQQAVRDVSRGTRASNTARNIGKLAPTGIVSGGIATGVPFAIGTTIGGPALGGALSAITAGAGLLGRRSATNMAANNAEMASVIARNGGALADQAPSAIQGLLGEAAVPATYLSNRAVVPELVSLLGSPTVARLAAEDDEEQKKRRKRKKSK